MATGAPMLGVRKSKNPGAPWLGETMDEENLKQVGQEASKATFAGFAQIGRMAIGNSGENSDSGGKNGRWGRSVQIVKANTAAKQMRDAARLRALQRTPYPMVLARIKLLLERMEQMKSPKEASLW
eukprot:gene1716-33123_t